MEFKFLLSTRTENPQKVEALAQQLGFDGIEVVMPNEKQSLRRWSCQGITQAHVIHAPTYEFDEKMFCLALTQALEVAQQLSVPRVNIHPGSRYCGGAENVRACIQTLRRLAAEHRRIVCYEVLAKPRADNTKHQRRLAYRSPGAWAGDVLQFKLPATLDTTHLASWGEDPAAYVRLLGPFLRHVHISDYDARADQRHLFLGAGTVDWKAFFIALREISGAGTLYLTLEPSQKLPLEKHQSHARESLGIMRRMLA